MNYLFVCTAAALRSPTGRDLFLSHGLSAVAAGTYYSDRSMPEYLSTEKVMWADVIFCMEKPHFKAVAHKLNNAPLPKKYAPKTLHLLGIPDVFERNNPILLNLFQPWLDLYLRIDPPHKTSASSVL